MRKILGSTIFCLALAIGFSGCSDQNEGMQISDSSSENLEISAEYSSETTENANPETTAVSTNSDEKSDADTAVSTTETETKKPQSTTSAREKINTESPKNQEEKSAKIFVEADIIPAEKPNDSSANPTESTTEHEEKSFAVVTESVIELPFVPAK